MDYRPFITGIGIIAVITMISAFLLNDTTPQSPEEQPETKARKTDQMQFKPSATALSRIPLILPVPDRLYFAGERVPLEIPSVRERFEKELYITAHRYYQVVFYLKRGPRILPRLTEELREAGIPEDFIYLTVIESDLIPTIESPKGAKGIWQFMPATARRYGMTVNRYVDERMNLEKATEAAIRYLKNARERTGSWTLAAAAYNMGLARTLRTQKQQQTDNYYEMVLNTETARYLFKILAAKVIIQSPDTFGYQMPRNEVYRYEPFETVEVRSGISDLVSWCRERGFSYYDLKRLNPWILRRTLPRGDYTLKVPSKSSS